MHHQPAYSACTRHGSNIDVREAWTPIFDRYGVDAVFAGHNHIYERSYPLNGGEAVSAGQGTTYIVTGGAGAPLYVESDNEPFNLVANPIEHYIIADFGPDGADFVVRDLDDNIIDEFTIPAN
ncbi:MAG: hypothetical protein AAFV53_26230 [Myxococcota bacterium]